MFKKSFLHGVLASLLTFVAAIIYNRIYFFATEVDFSRIINWKSLLGYSVLVSMMAALVNYGLLRFLNEFSRLLPGIQ